MLFAVIALLALGKIAKDNDQMKTIFNEKLLFTQTRFFILYKATCCQNN